ncbi:hypothetical protein GPECTOR_62g872 [Gonium pectorale]|uniref:Uncharacterized protein n=1 Tax=Gonium pectorale TaxID=33097 RepID=A0A150G4H5_GONPE|nr:hypothetical protein GPECTOR_62g872 [Gonium pectorale]|eukprot:KXZ44757.1 hypothetical protein GPECTOR_62g872 [Gonium pectorale]
MGALHFATEFGVHGDGGPSYAVATNGSFLAYSLPGSSGVELQSLRNRSAAPIRLSSDLQRRPVISLCFGEGPIGTSDPAPSRQGGRRPAAQPTALFCGSTDAVVAWNVTALMDAVAAGHATPPPIQVMAGQGPAFALTHSARLGFLVVCAGQDVHVFDVRTFRHIYRLDGHSADVLAAAFSPPPGNPHLLVTAGADRTFKIWDLEAGSLQYQSAVLCAAPLVSMALEPCAPPRLALGAADGTLRFFDLSGLPAARILQVVDVGRQLNRALKAAALAAAEAAAAAAAGPKVISSRPAWKAAMGLQRQPSQGGSDAGGGEDGDDSDGGSLTSSSECLGGSPQILQLAYAQPPPPPQPAQHLLPGIYDDDDDGAPPAALLPACPSLLVAMSGAIAVVDTRSYEVVEAFLLGRPDLPGAGGSGSSSAASLSSLGRQRSGDRAPPAVGGYGGVLSAAPPPPPALRSRITLRGVVRVEPCCCAAFAPAVPGPAPAGAGAAAGPGGEAAERSGVLCCTASAREPTVAVLRYLPSEGEASSSGGAGAGGNGVGALAAAVAGRLQRRPSSGAGSGSSAAMALNFDSCSDSAGAGGSGAARFTSPGRPPGSRPPVPHGASPNKSGKPGAGVRDQPVTFHSKIKSSGYGFVQPSTKLGRAPPPPVKVGKASATSSVGKHLMAARSYPLDAGPLTEHQPRNVLPGGEAVHPGGAIVAIAYSSDASRLLTASVNRTARVMRLPLSRFSGEGTDLVGHNAPLHAADWSRDGTMVLTASADRTARLWDAACAQPMLEFSHLHHQPPARPTGPAGAPAMPPPAPPSPAAAARSANPPLPHEVRAARFVYMDEVIGLACGNKLLLYRLKLADDTGNDIERLRARHSYKLVASHASSAQALLCFSATNYFLSPLVIASASNRALELIDLATMRTLATVPEAHQRTVGCVAQAGSASMFVNHPREAYELFATSAPDSCVKLWDVRTPQRCVRTFSGHKNSQLPGIGVAFSPCLRYLGVGSEDKQAYLYDLRQGVLAHKVGRGVLGDAVTGVAFNPLHPQLALATLDGRVAFFNDGSGGS